jgi:hypothetical protein
MVPNEIWKGFEQMRPVRNVMSQRTRRTEFLPYRAIAVSRNTWISLLGGIMEGPPFAGGSKGPATYSGFPKEDEIQWSNASNDSLSYASQVLTNTPSHCMNMLLN